MIIQKFDIEPLFFSPVYSKALTAHIEEIRQLLHKVLPKELCAKEAKEVASWIEDHLPLVKWEELIQLPDILPIYLLCFPPQALQADVFFLDLLKKWLIPEKEIDMLGMCTMSFYLKGINTRCLQLVQARILVEKGQDYLAIQNHLPLVAQELSLSLTSSRYAEYILHTKALCYEKKTTLVHQELRQLFHRYSSYFDQGIFIEMSRLLALSQVEFRNVRPARQITRMIISHYLLNKKLLRAISKFPEKRHVALRFLPTPLHFPFGSKKVLGVVIVIGLIDKYESFNETHIGLAVQEFLSNAQVVKGSFCLLKGAQDPIQGAYVELEKKNGTLFSLREIILLKSELGNELKKRIEKLIPSVFMIRNEEETMRNIFMLSQELRDPCDLPQVMISFDGQTASDLIFTVILVRLLHQNDLSLKECFQNVQEPFQFTSDRVQKVDYLQRKIPKEANVFHLHILKERSLLRLDSSVNFYVARQQVVNLLTKAIGEIRDYNGGMILKQGELFSEFKCVFKEIAQKNEELLENFFFGLSPIEVQATLPISSLETLFSLFLEAIGTDLVKKEQYFLKSTFKASRLFVVVCARDSSIEEGINKELLLFQYSSKSLIKTKVYYQGHAVLGYIYDNVDSKKRRQFRRFLEKAMHAWVKHVRSQQELRLSFIDLPSSLDPRQGGDDLSGTLLKMLFDGLTRITPEGKPTLSIAKSVEITSDLQQYTFTLRHCYWSNNTKVVAYDFEYAWKKVLSPNFETPFAYSFYAIKNARLAKEGKVSPDLIGVRALDEKTLVVELEHPTPEFLELTAHALYSPVNHLIDRIHPNWAQGAEDVYVCNGPFKLKRIRPEGGYELIKNSLYWDREVVHLQRIIVRKDSSLVANEMYKSEEIDWIGRPMQPWESYFSHDCNEPIHGKPIGTHWCVFNTQRFPFQHPKIRQAFGLAMNREEMTSILPLGSLPAPTPMSLAHTQNYNTSLLCGDQKKALQLFEEALEELGLLKKDFPLVTIIFTNLKSRESIAKLIQKQLQTTFGISCRIEGYEFRQLFARMTRGEYQMGMISWKTWINDPMYTLNAFKYRANTVNFAKWEHVDYQKLLNEALFEINPSKRLEYIAQAEKLLMQEMPIVPLFYEFYRYMHKNYVKGALHTETGNIDFKWASITL